MCKNIRVKLVLTFVALGISTWLVAEQFPNSPPKSERAFTIYSIRNVNGDILMLDALRGKTWMLRIVKDDQPTWLSIPRIDSEAEAMRLWQKSLIYTRNDVKNRTPFSLDIILKQRGYIEIPLKRLKSGYLGIDVRVEGKKVFMAIDTAAPNTHLDLERVKHLQLAWQPISKIDNKEHAIPTMTKSLCLIKLELGGVTIDHLTVGGNDLSAINHNLKLNLDTPIDGVLGSDVLDNLSTIIDYSTLKLYIIPKNKEQKKGHRELLGTKEVTKP